MAVNESQSKDNANNSFIQIAKIHLDTEQPKQRILKKNKMNKLSVTQYLMTETRNQGIGTHGSP